MSAVDRRLDRIRILVEGKRYREVEAEVFGPLAMHWYPDEDGDRVWNITHVRTGRAICWGWVATEDKVRALVHRLLPMADWEALGTTAADDEHGVVANTVGITAQQIAAIKAVMVQASGRTA